MGEEYPKCIPQLLGLEHAHDYLRDNRKTWIEDKHRNTDARPIAGNRVGQELLQREQQRHVRNEDEQRMLGKESNDCITREASRYLKNEPGICNIKKGDARRTC